MFGNINGMPADWASTVLPSLISQRRGYSGVQCGGECIRSETTRYMEKWRFHGLRHSSMSREIPRGSSPGQRGGYTPHLGQDIIHIRRTICWGFSILLRFNHVMLCCSLYICCVCLTRGLHVNSFARAFKCMDWQWQQLIIHVWRIRPHNNCWQFPNVISQDSLVYLAHHYYYFWRNISQQFVNKLLCKIAIAIHIINHQVSCQGLCMDNTWAPYRQPGSWPNHCCVYKCICVNC